MMWLLGSYAVMHTVSAVFLLAFGTIVMGPLLMLQQWTATLIIVIFAPLFVLDLALCWFAPYTALEETVSLWCDWLLVQSGHPVERE